ncbi:hypothetical protein GGR57DRAFT_447996 [Xylariaceae sp. FL1272]|nr:hypothetical protein GGR57DRAFT_447996 [Xylariaceae sp. FL1272]
MMDADKFGWSTLFPIRSSPVAQQFKRLREVTQRRKIGRSPVIAGPRHMIMDFIVQSGGGLAESKSEPSAKIYIACTGCKARKRRCDGRVPKCSTCVRHSAECIYAAARKARGPGKMQKDATRHYQRTEISSDLAPLPDSKGPERENYEGLVTHDSGNVRSRSSQLITFGDAIAGSKELVGSIPARAVFPEFLQPGIFERNLAKFKSEILENTSKRGFSPLLPLHVATRLAENSFADLMVQNSNFLKLSKFLELLCAQYADSAVEPGQDAARWALVNAVLASAVRFKTAAGSENQVSEVMQGLYFNATKVIPRLILQRPGLLSIQALVAMALFAREVPEPQAFAMLVSNASRQLEIFSRHYSPDNSNPSLIDQVHLEQLYLLISRLSIEASLVT